MIKYTEIINNDKKYYIVLVNKETFLETNMTLFSNKTAKNRKIKSSKEMFEKVNADTANPSSIYVYSLFGIENTTSSLLNF